MDRIELENRLSRARRLEALGTFAIGFAHNFNNVIGAILGHAEMAADNARPDTSSAYHVREIHKAAGRELWSLWLVDRAITRPRGCTRLGARGEHTLYRRP